MLRIVQRGLANKCLSRAYFSSGNIERPKDEIEETKYNPFKQDDLRGYEHYEQLTELEKDDHPRVDKRPNLWQSYQSRDLFYCYVSRVYWFLNSFLTPSSVLLKNDNLYLPKIAEGNVPIYKSHSIARTFAIMRKMWIFPFGIFFTGDPAGFFLSLTSFCALYYMVFKKLVDSFVINMELSPSTREIIYQKYSIVSGVVTKRVSVDDLQQFDFHEAYSDIGYLAFERAARSFLNHEVAFRVKSTKEELYFEKKGIWFEEGLNHELIV